MITKNILAQIQNTTSLFCTYQHVEHVAFSTRRDENFMNQQLTPVFSSPFNSKLHNTVLLRLRAGCEVCCNANIIVYFLGSRAGNTDREGNFKPLFPCCSNQVGKLSPTLFSPTHPNVPLCTLISKSFSEDLFKTENRLISHFVLNVSQVFFCTS